MADLFKSCGIGFTESVPVATEITSGQFEEMLESTRLVVINGEGTIHHARHYGRYILELGSIAKQQGRRVYLINATWDTNTEDMALATKYFDGIFVRDGMSQRQLQEYGVASRVVPDLSFLTNIAFNSHGQCGFVVFDSVRNDVSDVLARVARELRASRVSIYRARPENHGSRCQKAGRIELASWIRAVLTSAYDHSGCRIIQERSELLAYMAEHKFVLTGRFHAMCFSVLLGIPFLAVQSNSNKMSALVEDIGLAPERVQPANCSDRQLLGLLRQLGEYSEIEKTNIRSYVDRAYRSARNMSLQIASAVGTP
jgi:polysaccharide pyruvyl transferase WcaK-like protein